MSKEVTYSVVARKNMLKKDDPAKYYAQAQASGDVGLDEISTRVEKACTVHSADVVAVLKALEDEMVDGLSRGEIVRLGNIGTFQVGLRSRGAEKAEEFKAANISKARVNFRPGPVLADAMKTLNFSKVSTRAAQKGDGGGDGGVDEEILPHGFGKMKAVAFQQRPDGQFVAEIHGFTAFFRI